MVFHHIISSHSWIQRSIAFCGIRYSSGNWNLFNNGRCYWYGGYVLLGMDLNRDTITADLINSSGLVGFYLAHLRNLLFFLPIAPLAIVIRCSSWCRWCCEETLFEFISLFSLNDYRNSLKSSSNGCHIIPQRCLLDRSARLWLLIKFVSLFYVFWGFLRSFPRFGIVHGSCRRLLLPLMISRICRFTRWVLLVIRFWGWRRAIHHNCWLGGRMWLNLKNFLLEEKLQKEKLKRDINKTLISLNLNLDI